MRSRSTQPWVTGTTLLLILVLSSCSGSPSGQTPAEKVAVSFVRALAQGDGEAACPLMTPDFLEAVKADMQESGWADESDGTCEGYVTLASQLVAGSGGIRVQAVTSTTPSPGAVEVVVSSKNQPDNTYLVKMVGTTWLIHEHINSDDF